ncbi:hypothetical protein AVEN_255422-1, partial [Araneus ventricosus]
SLDSSSRWISLNSGGRWISLSCSVSLVEVALNLPKIIAVSLFRSKARSRRCSEIQVTHKVKIDEEVKPKLLLVKILNIA